MKQRIGLFTPAKKKKKGGATTSATYVEVSTLTELTEKLASLGAKRVGLLLRERTGTTKLEGKMVAPSELGAEHLKWLLEKPAEFQTRGLFYE